MELKQRSSQYEHIRMEVEDDGYGMTPEYLETASTREMPRCSQKRRSACPS